MESSELRLRVGIETIIDVLNQYHIPGGAYYRFEEDREINAKIIANQLQWLLENTAAELTQPSE